MTDETRKVKKPAERPEETVGKSEELSVEQLEKAAGGSGPLAGGGSLGMDSTHSARKQR